MKTLLLIFIKAGIILFLFSCNMLGKNQAEIFPREKNVSAIANASTFTLILRNRAAEARAYSRQKNFSTRYCFLIDMSIPSGKKRFFVYDFLTNRIVYSGLVSHGSGGIHYSSQPKFSNSAGSDCTSLGKYRIGELYRGEYGKSYKLYGLEGTNSNAYKRAVVLHPYDCVPNNEIYPQGVCNSSGCAGVSPKFFDLLSIVIRESQKPILLWIYS